MDSKQIILIAVIVILTLLIGCTSLPANEKTFQLGAAFTAKENIRYTSTENGIQLHISNFADSRCPKDVQCIWEGEQGVDVTIFLGGDPPMLPETVHLGEVRARTAKYNNSNYEVELVSINTDTNTAEIIVRKLPSAPTTSQGWFSIEPMQCGNNAWTEWTIKNMSFDYYAPAEKEIIGYWLKGAQGVTVYDSASKQNDGVVCEACTCKTGETIAVLVDLNNSAKMQELGFTNMGLIPCTMEARSCSDGNFVGRTAPFCEFAPCTTS